MVPKMKETARRTECMSHLSELSMGFVMKQLEDPKAAQRWSGSSLWLAMRRNVPHAGDGRDTMLLCPGDVAAMPPGGTADWNGLDLERPPRELCSYAGRDFARFPIDENDVKKQAIGACVHHRGGAVVAFDAGDVQFMTREELGLEPDADIKTGPDSASPVLRVLRGGD
jgi:hypothetical protein